MFPVHRLCLLFRLDSIFIIGSGDIPVKENTYRFLLPQWQANVAIKEALERKKID